MTDIPQAHRTPSFPRDGVAAKRFARLLDLLVSSAKSLARSPGFTSPMLALMSLGIGVATVLWAVAYGVLLRPLPFPAPDRLVAVSETQQAIPSSMSPSNFRDFAQQSASFEALAAYAASSAALSLEGAPAEEAA
jgi:putative ABC transport system permease protein